MGIHPRAKRTGVGAAILGAHLAALYGLLALRPPAPPAIVERPPLIVMLLPRREEAPPAGAGRPAFAAPGIVPLLPPLLPAPNAITLPAPVPDPAQAALRGYLGCRLPGESGGYTEDKERCAKMLRDLPVGPLPDPQQTEAEKQLAQKFDHAQKTLNSPTVVPCLAGLMINPLCIAATLMNGGDFISTYADTPSHPSAPLATGPLATGMVNKSGHTPGTGLP